MNDVQVRGPRLEIKKDVKGMVHVPGATLVTVHSAKELLSTIEKGQLRRHVGETQASFQCFLTSLGFLPRCESTPATSSSAAWDSSLVGLIPFVRNE